MLNLKDFKKVSFSNDDQKMFTGGKFIVIGTREFGGKTYKDVYDTESGNTYCDIPDTLSQEF